VSVVVGFVVACDEVALDVVVCGVVDEAWRIVLVVVALCKVVASEAVVDVISGVVVVVVFFSVNRKNPLTVKTTAIAAKAISFWSIFLRLLGVFPQLVNSK
jgi:hypothetical protein